jgi:predicted RNA-binding protein with PUA-like domain
MAKGDKAFFYHTGDEKQIVGIVEIAKTAYPDPTAEKDSPWVVVDTVAAEPLKTPVTLAQIKADKALADMILVKIGRLSVQPVTAAEWKHICKLGGVKG